MIVGGFQLLCWDLHLVQFSAFKGYLEGFKSDSPNHSAFYLYFFSCNRYCVNLTNISNNQKKKSSFKNRINDSAFQLFNIKE